MLRRSAVGLVAGILALASFPVGRAAAQSCDAIQRQIAAIGSPGNSLRFERAFREQQAVLIQTQQQARSAGCMGGGFLFFRAQPQPICQVLVPKLAQMQANLGKLDRQRQGGGAQFTDARRLRMLQAMASAQGCGPGGTEQAQRNFDQDEPDNRVYESDVLSRGGTFRTLCVRNCDGFYFPISFATTRGQFATDAETCQSMCPSAAAELYVHPNPGGGPEDMVSLSGERYSALPTAFQYRTSLTPSCTCNTAKPGGDTALLSTPLRANAAPAEPTARLPGLPRARPAPGDDPETVANLMGGYVPQFIGSRADAVVSDAATSQARTADGRPVRVVGPAYWGGQEKAGVVLTPVPN